MININKQLRRYFILITLLAVLFITIVSNIGINYFFRSYVEQSKLRDDLQLVAFIEEAYRNAHGFDTQTMINLTSLAHGEGLVIKIKNLENQTLFDSTKMHMGPGMGMGRGRNRRYRQIDNLVYQNYPLIDNEEKIGIIEIGRPGSILAHAEDRNFIYTMNGIYIAAFIFSVAIAVIVSLYVSKKFLKPLLSVKDNVAFIAGEQYDKVTDVNTKTVELHHLSSAIRGLAQKLQNQESLRKRLTADVAHELRTPLATLQSHLEAFLDGVWEPTQEKLSSCYDEVIRLTKLIKDLSDLSGIESDDIQLNKQPVNLSELLENVIEHFQPLLMSKQIETIQEIQPNIVMAGDADRLNQILINLLSNAYKYTNEHGKIFITLSCYDHKIEAVIKDTGKGIAKEDMPYIFERFYRGDVSRNRKTGGTGIGLTITKALVEAHHGTIKVDSTLGKGTSVRIEFEHSS